MTTRNVDLLIRARDGASKAFREVSKALDELGAIQGDVASKGAKLDKSLGESKGSATALARAIGADTERGARQAERAFERIEATVRKNVTAFARLQRELRESEGNYAGLKAQAEAAKRVLDRTRASLESGQGTLDPKKLQGALAEYKRLNAEIEQSGPALDRQQQEFRQSEAQLARITQAARAATLALNDVRATNTRVQDFQRRRPAASQQTDNRSAEQLRAQSAAADAAKRATDALADAQRRSQAASRASVQDQERLAQSFRRAISATRSYQPSLRQIVRELAGLGPATAQASSGVRRLSSEMFNARRAFRAFYGDSRQALSLMQRVRGEVLSLTASFVGFYGIFQQGRGFLEAFQSLEAAQNRLGAAFNQDYGRVNAELERLQDEASRLGISFGTLSDNYSKFLLSGQQAGLEVAQLQEIFRQVSEAGRVLKLSNEQISGTFTALTQIAGKGTLQMEELRQQLGDRLPGAVGIVANALGYAEDQLADFYKAVENGQVGAEEALVALGKGLEETYGGQLEDALDSVTAKIGELQNLFFQRQLTAANSGFIDGIEEAIDAINEFLSGREGIEFFEAIGAAFERIVGVLPVLLENMDLIVAAFQAFVAIKIGQVVSGFAANLTRLGQITIANKRVQVALNGAVMAFSPAAATAMAGATRLGAAMRGLRAIISGVVVTLRTAFAAFGGIVGIAAAALSFFAFNALGNVNDAAQENREQMRQIEEVIGKVGEAYRKAAGDSAVFAEEIRKLPLLDMKVRLREAKEALDELREATQQRNLFASDGLFQQLRDEITQGASDDLFLNFTRLRDGFEEGRIGARELLEGLRELGRETDELSQFSTLGPFLEQLEEMADAEDKVARLEAEVAVIEGTATDAQKALLGLAEEVENTGDSADESKKKMQDYVDAMRELGENIPEINEKLKELDALAEIEEDFRKAMEAANQFGDELERTQRKAEAFNLRNDALKAFYEGQVAGFDGTDGVEVAANFLRQSEGFRANPYFDVNAFRAGYGSDTVTLADGTVKQVVQGMSVSVADANRDLLRRITQEFIPIIIQQIGPDRFNSFNAQQQAALISIAYNYGELPERILAAARNGTVDEVAGAIRRLAGDNEGVNSDRRNKEAALFSSNAGVPNLEKEFDRNQAEARRDAERQAEQQEKALESLRDYIKETEREAELQDKRLIDAEVEKALDEQRNKLAKAGLELTEEQAAEIERVTRAKFAQAQADEDRNASLEKARALEEQVTLLQERRRFLLDQQTQQEGQGDLVGAARTAEELAEVETALDSAIDKALSFWEALGGDGSERAILGLQTVRQELNRVESKALYTGEQINNMISDGLGSAVSAFAKAVANSEDAWGAFRQAALQALSDVLIQIGQAIVKQALLNALTGGGGAGGGVGGGIAGIINSIVAHGGGIAGGAGPSHRQVSPAIFANAARYHSGGIAGLAPNEVPAILKQGEEVLTEGDPRHRFNGGGSSEAPTIINTFDPQDVMDRALASPNGKRTFVNTIRGNRTEIKAALGL